MARECSYYFFSHLFNGEKSSVKNVSFLLPIGFIRISDIFQHFCRFLSFRSLWLRPNRDQEKMSSRAKKETFSLTNLFTHFKIHCGTIHISLFLYRCLSTREKIHWIIFFSLLTDLVVTNAKMYGNNVVNLTNVCVCVQKLSSSNTSKTQKNTHDNQHSAISEYMLQRFSNTEQAKTMFVS